MENGWKKCASVLFWDASCAQTAEFIKLGKNGGAKDLVSGAGFALEGKLSLAKKGRMGSFFYCLIRPY